MASHLRDLQALRRRLVARRHFVPWGSSTPLPVPTVARTPATPAELVPEPEPAQQPAVGYHTTNALTPRFRYSTCQHTSARALVFDRTAVLSRDTRTVLRQHVSRVSRCRNMSATGSDILVLCVQEDALPEGIEPLVLWQEPQAGAQGEGAAGGADSVGGGSGGCRVEVDNMLVRFLRPHQREGVQFMFDCVTGQRIEDKHGEAQRHAHWSYLGSRRRRLFLSPTPLASRFARWVLPV